MPNIEVKPYQAADRAADPWAAFPIVTPAADNTAREQPAGDKWAAYPIETAGQAKSFSSYAKDVGLSGLSGVAKGVATMAGLPGDASNWIDAGIEWAEQVARGESDEQFARRTAERNAKLKASQASSVLPRLRSPTSSQVRAGIETVTGPLHEPETTAGKYAQSVGEFIPAALVPGGGVRSVFNLAVLPGLASEAAGQATEGTAAEPWARAGAAIATGGAASVLNRPRTAARALSNAMGPGVDETVLNNARQLMDDAAQRGVQLTWAEVIEQVAPGSGLTNMQRVLESTPGSREHFDAFMARRPQQVERAARQSFDDIAPINPAPSGIGPAAGRAGEDVVNRTRQIINTHSEPHYDRAATILLNDAEMRRVRSLPGFEQARRTVRGDPQLNRDVASLPDNSIGFLNEVKKELDRAAKEAAAPLNQQKNMQRSSGYGSDATVVRDILTRKSPDYKRALDIQTTARERYLQPLLDGPLGKLASKDVTTRNAIDALFPKNPLPNSEQEIAQAVGALAKRSPRITRDLVRAHAESVFNEAARDLQGGANQFGGAKFAKVLVGNSQQRANLEAAVKAMAPDGDRIWQGFERFLDVVQATGTRQPIGSRTSFNTLELTDQSTGSMLGNAAKTGLSPQKWLNVVSDSWSRWQLGNNLDELARILTDPRSFSMLKGIAKMPPGSKGAAQIAGRLALIGGTALANNR